ncbi:hypothetical protein C0993_003962 [Termitomyces sp. T159_Od127]|nr:hypothetical protein C0993_003962 [Termitomyces sp. T159_Od127]
MTFGANNELENGPPTLELTEESASQRRPSSTPPETPPSSSSSSSSTPTRQTLAPTLPLAPPPPTFSPNTFQSDSANARHRNSRSFEDLHLDPYSTLLFPPSAHASPRGRLVPLTNDDAFDFSAAAAAAQDGAAPLDDNAAAGMPMTVSKLNVTTGRTANASQRRRNVCVSCAWVREHEEL